MGGEIIKSPSVRTAPWMMKVYTSRGIQRHRGHRAVVVFPDRTVTRCPHFDQKVSAAKKCGERISRRSKDA